MVNRQAFVAFYGQGKTRPNRSTGKKKGAVAMVRLGGTVRGARTRPGVQAGDQVVEPK